jgi:hypothetical protein
VTAVNPWYLERVLVGAVLVIDVKPNGSSKQRCALGESKEAQCWKNPQVAYPLQEGQQIIESRERRGLAALSASVRVGCPVDRSRRLVQREAERSGAVAGW